MLFLCYPKCTTCKATQKELDQLNYVYTTRNIKEEHPSYEELKDWWTISKQPLKKFFNTSGNSYKALELKDKLQTMSEEEQLRLLATDGMLVKRPMIIEQNKVTIGKKEILAAYTG